MARKRLHRRTNVTPQKRPGSYSDHLSRAAKVVKHGTGVVKAVKDAWTQHKSKSKTKGTQTKRIDEHIKQNASGEYTRSFFTYRTKPSKVAKVHKLLANTAKYETQTVSQLLHTDDQNTPRQQESVPFHILNGTDYGALVNTYFQNLNDADPYHDKYPAAGGLGFKVLLESCRYELEMCNMAAGMTMCDIYILLAKTTGTYEDPLTTWANAITADAGTSLTTTGTRNFPGNKPTYYKQFNATWKVLKHTNLTFMAGSMHRHIINWNLNKMTDYAYWSKYTMVKGITGAVLVVGRGQIADDTKGMKGTQVVSYMPIKIDMVVRQYSKIRIISTLPTNHYYNNAVGTVTYDEDVTTDHLYIPTADGDVVDTHDIANIA